MATYKIVLVEQAVDEFEKACVYYNDKVVGLGFEFEKEVIELLAVVQKNPLLFSIKFENVHEAVVKSFPFVVTYEVIDKLIIVLSVFHTNQKPAKKMKRKKK
jgi:hypothetical protein